MVQCTEIRWRKGIKLEVFCDSLGCLQIADAIDVGIRENQVDDTFDF